MFTDTWATAVDSSIRHLAVVSDNVVLRSVCIINTSVRHRPSVTTSISRTKTITVTSSMSALIWHVIWLAIGSWVSAFELDPGRIVKPGMYAGGKMLNNQTIVNTALRLNDACWNTYASTAYAMVPTFVRYATSLTV